MSLKPSLPIDAALSSLLESARSHSALVVSASPGAGKTTRLPPALLSLTDKAVWVLEPRRIAAIAAAARIAEENGWSLGKEVGYQVRFENRSSRDTRLLFLTEALLLRKLLQDPELKNVGCVVLDEFHERSLHVDLALGALKELQELSRPDLKIVVMSATLDAAPISRFLGNAPVAEVPGKIFPLEIRNEASSQLLRTGPEFTERLRKLVQKAFLENREGDILCFLPGRGEIEWLERALAPFAGSNGAVLFPLHGQLKLEEQRTATQPLPGRRKIILSTNVAESSLTVEGVRIVVDSGLARIAEIHPRTGFESLELTRISKASAKQRAGRAARQGPGIVYRAWTSYDELSMKEFESPEILRSDLSESLLLLSALGVTSPGNFSWFEAPPPRALARARDFLRALGAISEDGSLTPLGASLRGIPLHPRLAKLLLRGKELGLPRFSSEIAALLSEPSGKNPGPRFESENDLWGRYTALRQRPLLVRAAQQLHSLIGAEEDTRSGTEHELLELLLESYPDRFCRRRRPEDPQAKMAGGRGVKLHPDSSVKRSEFFLALELSEGRDAAETLVFAAVGIPDSMVQEKIRPLASPATKLSFDEEKQRFWVTESLEWNGVPIGNEHRRPAASAEIEEELAEIAFEQWERILAKNESLAAWHARLNFLHKNSGGRWPLLSEEQKREALAQACYGENSLAAVAGKELVSYFENILGDSHREALAKECPDSWVVPSGSRIRIRYTDEQGPQVEVRLQELFGLKSAPRIGGQLLTLSLLAPNYRPVQLTRDLESFWRNGYQEVRKEMRARYPKHSWPEDPTTAAPQAKGRPRN